MPPTAMLRPSPSRWPDSLPGRTHSHRSAFSITLFLATLCLSLLTAVPTASAAPSPPPLPRPNILWITSEDNGPHLGCYGDPYASTPNLDRLAARGMLYLHAWSVAPVCAPARTAIISGLYPSSTGAEHMRSLVPLPAHFRFLPQYLQAEGYYCSNNSKEDYNLAPNGKPWNESSTRAHWKNRAPGQPFFAVFNHTQSHESQVRTRPHTPIHDPAQAPIPAYHPDTPEVRRDWAQYYDQVSVIDTRAGQNLRELEAAGLADDTIVFYFGDHGPGLPRGKRSACNSGLRVPLIVHIPEKYRHLAPPDYQPGAKSSRLVSFVDLAPTLLSLCGIPIPAHLQGHAFLGPAATPPPEFLHGQRGRMDERIDLVRTVRDTRFVYVRNFMPHRIAGQHVSYMFETPTTRVWHQLFTEGKINAAQSAFWQTRQPEELYDLASDPDETVNLANSAAHRSTLERFRRELRRHQEAIRDVDLLPEGELQKRTVARTPYELGHDPAAYPLHQVLDAAELAASHTPLTTRQVNRALRNSEAGVRYWTVLGVLIRGRESSLAHVRTLRAALDDPSPSVRIAAAETLATFGSSTDRARAIDLLLEHALPAGNPSQVQIEALNALDNLSPLPAPTLEQIAALPLQPLVPSRNASDYAARLIKHILQKPTP